MKLILLGAAGSGKGTLAKNITKDFGIPQLSMGDMLRDIANSGSELGKKIGEFQKNGILVTNDIVFEVLKIRLGQEDCKNGFILDGYPRTLEQAELLKKVTEVDAVVSVELPFDEIERRLAARRTCPKCGEIDNTSYAGFTGNCRKCQTPMFQRNDDKPEAIKVRLEVYKQNITPLINFYSDRLFKVSSAGSPEETYKPVKNFLQNLEA